jgi:hypothetical protein
MLRTWTLVLLLLAGLQAFAQEPKPRVLLYKDRLAAQFDTVKVVKNAIKANPLLFFRGEVPIYFERALTHKLSLELGIGITLRDYLGLSFIGDDADDFGAGTEIRPNPSYHMAARFYLGQDLEPQGWYLQPGFSHLAYTKDIVERAPDGGFTDNTFRDRRIYNDMRLLLGYQMLGATSNWLFDVYGGLGYRDRNMKIVRETIDLTTQQFTYIEIEKNDRIFVPYIGVKVGVGF